MRFVLKDPRSDYYFMRHPPGDFDPDVTEDINEAAVFTAMVCDGKLSVEPRLPDGDWTPVAVTITLA